VRTNISSLMRGLAVGMMLACGLSGCARFPFYLGPDWRKPTPAADTAEIEYRLDASQLHAPVAVARVEGQQVCYEEVASSLIPDRTVGTLKILYPCADAPVGFARAEVRMTTDPLPKMTQLDESKPQSRGWLSRFGRPRDAESDAVKETWAFDLPKPELDRLLNRLATPGSVTIPKKGEPAAGNISTFFNDRRSAGSCQPIPELDALMRKVRNEGHLVEYSNPASAHGKQTEPASLVAYRKAHEQDASGANGLNMVPNETQLAQSGLSMPCSAPTGRIIAVRPSPDAPVRR
jgi:hypothetical protein